MSDRGPIWTARSRSRAAHYRLPCTRASCSVHQRGHADMRYVRRGARANENGLCWPSACRVRTLLSKRGIASKRCGRDALPSDHHARAPKRGTMPRPPSVLAGGRWLHRTNTSTAPHATCGHHGSTTTAARKANSLHAVQTVRLAGTSDVAASSSSTLQIWPTRATTSAAPSLDPGSAATQLPENGLQGSFYFP